MWHIFPDEFDRNKRTLQSGNHYDHFIHFVQEHFTTQRKVRFYAELRSIRTLFASKTRGFLLGADTAFNKGAFNSLAGEPKFEHCGNRGHDAVLE